ncbi:MAG: sle, partial [Frankiales bacterium]|nr:sle [Frankiales bacterium]
MTSPAVLRARALADELLRPAAERVDRDVVPRSHLDAWAAAGLLGLSGPPAYGGG